MRIVLSFILLFSLASCGYGDKPPFMKNVMIKKSTSPLYKEGFKDGCETGYGSIQNSYYQQKYKFTQDWRLIEDSTYYKAWSFGYVYCRSVSLKWSFDPIDKRENIENMDNSRGMSESILSNNEMNTYQGMWSNKMWSTGSAWTADGMW